MKKILIALGIIFVLLVVVVAAVPFFIDANKYKPMVEEQANKALGRKLTLGNIDLSVWHGGVVIHDISISEDPVFGQKPFLEAKSLSVGVEIWPYITNKEIRIKTITLDSPQIRLVSNAAGRWNFSSLGKSAAAAGSGNKSSTPGGAFTIQNLSIDNGKIALVSAGREHDYEDVSVDVSNLAPDSRFPFTISV